MAAPTTAAARVGEVRFRLESTPGAAIADPATYFSTSPSVVRAYDCAPESLDYLNEENPALQPSAFAMPNKLLLTKAGTFPFKIKLPGLNQAAVSGTPVTQDPIGLLLKCAFGGESLGTSRAVGAASGTGTVASPLVVNIATGLNVGDAIMIDGEARRIVSVSGTNLVLDQALSAAPALSTLIKAAANYYIDESALTNLADADHDTLAVLWRGAHADDQMVMRGCWVTVEPENLTPGQVPTLSVVMHPTGWEQVTGVAVGTVATEAAPPVQKDSGLYLNEAGTESLNRPHVRSFNIKLGMAPVACPSPQAENGVEGHVCVGGAATVDFEAYYDGDWFDKFTDLQSCVGGYQIGEGILFSFPNLRPTAWPKRVGGQATVGAAVSFHADNGSLSTDAGKSRISIHRFAY
jgi:hypothetical protein